MTALVTLPNPADVPLPTVVGACEELTAILRADGDIGDLEAVVELLDRMAAIESYLAKKNMHWAAMTPARLLEARIGRMLGPAVDGLNQWSGGVPRAVRLGRNRRMEFRLLDMYRPAWEPFLPLSRAAVLLRINQVRRPAHEPPELRLIGTKRYGLVLADPPWPLPTGVEDASVERHYPLMTIEAIAAMPVVDIVRDDALLYLWAISTHLHEAFHVLEAWGFAYVSSMVWIKDRAGTGWWTRHRHETLLIGRRGHWSPPPFSMRPESVITAPRARHSEKPAAVAELLERLWPDVPRIELFAREPRPGWDAIGDEL